MVQAIRDAPDGACQQPAYRQAPILASPVPLLVPLNIVLEIGGQLSHGAIVAREYGVPAVVNVAGAMAAIRDGQPITVDGSTGQVVLEQDAVAQPAESLVLAVPA